MILRTTHIPTLVVVTRVRDGELATHKAAERRLRKLGKKRRVGGLISVIIDRIQVLLVQIP